MRSAFLLALLALSGVASRNSQSALVYDGLSPGDIKAGLPPGQTIPTNSFDFTRLVFIGDSLLAGFRDGGLVDVYQRESIAARIAAQGQVNLAQPLIGWPGFPNVLKIASPGMPPVIIREEGTSTGRVDLASQPFNLAVPAHRVAEALAQLPAPPVDNLTDLILGLPGLLGGTAKSQVEWAEALKPTTIIIWIGANDTLWAALDGDTNLITPESVFASGYAELMTRLSATGARLIAANIPEATAIPYLTPAETFAAMAGVPLDAIGPMLGIKAGDYLTLPGVAAAGAILQQQLMGPLTNAFVVSAEESLVIQAATHRFNAIIAAQAQQHRAILVDTHALLSRWKTGGAEFKGQRLTTDFLGGIFGLDGFHPTGAGSILTANEFIRAMNQAGADLPLITWVTLKKEGAGLAAYWPGFFTGYRLESSTSFGGGTWSTVPGTPTQENGNFKMTLSSEGSGKFFRLVR